MSRETLSDEQVEVEILRLNRDGFVQLARLEQKLKYRKRQYLYTLRSMEKRGKELAEGGMTREKMLEMYKE